MDHRSRYYLFLRVSRTFQEMEVSANALEAPSITVTLNTRHQPKPCTLPALLI